MTVEEIEKKYCSKCIHNDYCYKPCPQVISRQLEDAFDYYKERKNNEID